MEPSIKISNNLELINYHKNLIDRKINFCSFWTDLRSLSKLDFFDLQNKLDNSITSLFEEKDTFSYIDFKEDKKHHNNIFAKRLIQIYLLSSTAVYRDPITVNRINQDVYVIHPGSTRIGFNELMPNKITQVFYYDSTGLDFDLNYKISIFKKQNYKKIRLQNFPVNMLTYSRPVLHRKIESHHTVFELHSATWGDKLEDFIIKNKLIILYDKQNQTIRFNNKLIYYYQDNKWNINIIKGTNIHA